jgi:hypothetical protein
VVTDKELLEQRDPALFIEVQIESMNVKRALIYCISAMNVIFY